MSSLQQNSPKPKLTFVLPGDYRSGGVRVTVLMGNELIRRGYDVRVVCVSPERSYKRLIKWVVRERCGLSKKNTGWLHEFSGPIETSSEINNLEFKKGEIVFAVGTYVVKSLRALKQDVVKVRYNHGMPSNKSPENIAAWKGALPTITVSNTIVPLLEEESGDKVRAVVPNGIDLKQYFYDSEITATGIGAVYNPHPNKDPDLMLKVLQKAHEKWPDVPQHIFSTEPQPEALSHANYKRYPSIDEARAIYNKAKAWIVTSRTEGLPGVVLESMACGTPVISSDNDGSLEIIENDTNGLVVPQSDLDAYLEQIEKLLEDDQEYERLSRGALNRAAEFSWERAADKMESFLRTL